ncbi:uncharacterized protein [Fopius arisanus]|uniref:Uncharacterized protein n=2 Tax=Fopius arisanus TaxID=64838 RepID=A0A9R1T133_9HYME|nr:PREDICTED: uncharacterized protein LOC105265156 [Fopius arisanus]
MKLKDLVLSASSPPKSINEGLFFPEPSENPVTASWKFSEVFKPKYLKPKIPPRFKRSADLPAPDKLPNYPLSESRIEKRYSNLELVGVKPEVLYRHPGLSVEEQSKPQKKIAISSESFRRTPPGVNEPIVLPLPSKPLSYTTIIGNCNGTSSEVSDLNLSINSNRFLGRIVIPDPDPFLVGSEPYKLPEETKQANRTYVNLQDHQAVISSPPDQGNHSDILPYNPDDIPYVEVPDYTDRREESLDDNNNENMKDKYSNVDNDAVDPGTLPNEEGEKSSPFVGSESERTKEEDFTVKKIANDSGETSQVGNQHGKSRKDSEVVRRSEERPIKNSRPDEKSEEFSNAKINPKNITGSAEAELEPVSLDVEDFVKPFDLDKFINELFHRNHKTNTEESKAEASRKELTDDSEEEEFNHWRYSDYYGPHNDGTNEDESKDYFESHESQNEPYANPDDFLRKHFTGDVIHKFKKSDLKTDEKPTNSHSVTGFLSKLPIRVKNYEPKGQERKNNRPKYQKQWVLEYGFPSRTDKTNA